MTLLALLFFKLATHPFSANVSLYYYALTIMRLTLFCTTSYYNTRCFRAAQCRLSPVSSLRRLRIELTLAPHRLCSIPSRSSPPFEPAHSCVASVRNLVNDTSPKLLFTANELLSRTNLYVHCHISATSLYASSLCSRCGPFVITLS